MINLILNVNIESFAADKFSFQPPKLSKKCLMQLLLLDDNQPTTNTGFDARNSIGWQPDLGKIGNDADPDCRKSFKQRKSFATRKEELSTIRARFPNKVPIIVERFKHERTLPVLDKTKFLVPAELLMGRFLMVLRNRMNLDSRQSIYLMINNQTVVSMSKTMGEIYKLHKDKDEFLYITYSSQEMFG